MKVIDKKHFLATTRIYKDDGLDVAHNKMRVRRLIKAQEEIDAISVDKVKQAREEMQSNTKGLSSRYMGESNMLYAYNDCISILDKLIESEDK